MKKISFVILFVTVAAFAKLNNQATKANWPKAITQTVQNKTLKAICENKTYCTDISATDLNDPAVFKISSVNDSTLMISYKNIFVNIQHNSQNRQFKVNQKPLDIAQIKNVNDLKQQIMTMLPTDKHSSLGFNWFNYAQAEFASPAQFQMTMAMTRLILATEENDICQQTLQVAAQCEQFGKETAGFMTTVNQSGKSSVTDSMTDKMKLEKNLLKKMYEISSMMGHLDQQFNSLSPTKKASTERCECQGEACKMAETSDKPTQLGQQFKNCIADAKRLRANLPSSAELQERLDKIENFLNDMRPSDTSAIAPAEKDFTKNSNGR